jgi:hypothetical protein
MAAKSCGSKPGGRRKVASARHTSMAARGTAAQSCVATVAATAMASSLERHGQHHRRSHDRPLLWQPLANDVGVDAVAERNGRHRGARLQALGDHLRFELRRICTTLASSQGCRCRVGPAIDGVRYLHSGRDLYAATSTPQDGGWSDYYPSDLPG